MTNKIQSNDFLVVLCSIYNGKVLLAAEQKGRTEKQNTNARGDSESEEQPSRKRRADDSDKESKCYDFKGIRVDTTFLPVRPT